MSWDAEDDLFADTADGRRGASTFVPQPVSMVYAPPNRIMVRMPTLTTSVGGKHRVGSSRGAQPQRSNVATTSAKLAPGSLSVPPSLEAVATTAPRRSLPVTLANPSSNAVRKGPTSKAVSHETNVTITMDTPVPWFAVNVPRAVSARASSSSGAGGVSMLCTHSLTSNDVYGGRIKGWVEPCPDNIATVERGAGGPSGGGSTVGGTPEVQPTTDVHGAMRSPLALATSARRVGVRSLMTLPTVVLQQCFGYLQPTEVDDAVVHISLRCYHAVRSSAALSKLRFEFVLPCTSPPAAVVPPWGVIRYLASRRMRPTPAEEILQADAPQQPSGISTVLNPCVRPDPDVRVVVVAPERLDATGTWPQGPSSPSAYVPSPPRALRCAVSAAASPHVKSSSSKNASTPANRAAGFVPNEQFLSWGPSRFLTPSIPYAWVGVEFRHGYAVQVTGYAFCVSNGSSSFPVAWELQGCCVSSQPRIKDPVNSCGGELSHAAQWTEEGERWRVLHKVEARHSSDVTGRSPQQHNEDARRGTSASSPLEHGHRMATFHVRPHRWGPMSRLRIIQTSRNSQWGHELPISGFEVYGSLSRRHI